jgi:hypothetical protein
MHAVIETPRFLASAEREGLDDDERMSIVTLIATNPTLGDLIPGTGGARKLRMAGRGKGKSGGYRVITYYAGEESPVFLLDVYGKGRRSDISMAERHAIRRWAAALATWRKP